ncbi:MAG TPA: protein translocase subunit SecD [Ignavibacteriaceae bacterium]|nr:protein translocase subunit SecD [Ignavibacteriaceae bacterium]
MKEFRFRLIIILAFIAFSIYLLYPTYLDYRNSKNLSETLEKERLILKANNPNITKAQMDTRLKLVEDSIKAMDPSIVKAKQDRIKLGLDLQGGMRVVLEVNTAKLLEKLAKNPDDVFKKTLADAEKEVGQSEESIIDVFASKLKSKGINLSRYYGNIKDDDADIITRLRKDSEDAVSRAMEIIRNRVDQYGVSEPSIQMQGSRRLIVELPGIANEDQAKQLLQGTALLEFRILKDPEFASTVMQKIDDVLAGISTSSKEEKDTTASNDSTLASNDTTKVSNDTLVAQNNDTNTSTSRDSVDYSKLPENEREKRFAKDHPFFNLANPTRNGEALVLEDNRERVKMLLNRNDIQKVIPNNSEFVFSAKPFVNEGKKIYTLYLVNKKAELTGGVITNARHTIDQTTSAPIVTMEMNAEGSTSWARITGANINKRIAIILDGVVYSAPVVRNKITGGSSQIEGMDNVEEATLLEIVLKAGALPAPINMIEERTVGPSLGQDSVNKGFFSAILGYILVGVFMIFYYKKAGAVAAVGLMFTILFILGILAGFGATLTLPGIAGIILTIGMAVDSNVLIYERMREELATGKTIKAVVDSGFSKAFSAILDSNVTTLFTGLILYQFGTGPVKGFAVTLMIGIVTSLFGTLVIARLIFDYMVYKGHKITIG